MRLNSHVCKTKAKTPTMTN